MKIIKSAAAYQLKRKVFIQGYSVTTIGLNRLKGPVFMAEEDDYIDLGKAVLNALNECKTGIYHEMPGEYDPKKSLMVIATGMKNWNALMKLSKSIDVYVYDFADKNITFMPCRFLGTSGDKKGYDWIEDKSITSDLNPENLGRALLEAFSYSENPYLK